ncbi:hypothetical protein OF117_22085, partial [Geodermatophilus sp. YIM 151500]|uniref:hypothetical protein n=1 Tax=Geodermatophilus sp. YIM 151500 TaxID=2984531 RepID=UPI0021E4F22F
MLSGFTTGDQPAGTLPIDGASSAVIETISTSPSTSPAGRGTLTAVAAVRLTDWAEAPTVIAPAPPPGGGPPAVTVIVRVAGAPAPAAFDAISRTVYVPA